MGGSDIWFEGAGLVLLVDAVAGLLLSSDTVFLGADRDLGGDFAEGDDDIFVSILGDFSLSTLLTAEGDLGVGVLFEAVLPGSRNTATLEFFASDGVLLDTSSDGNASTDFLVNEVGDFDDVDEVIGLLGLFGGFEVLVGVVFVGVVLVILVDMLC